MRRGDVRPITVDGKAFDAEYLGRGHYATAWQAGERVNLWMMRVWCTNLALGESFLRQVHLGKRLADDISYSEQTYRLDTRATAAALKDTVRHAIGPAVVNGIVANIAGMGAAELKDRQGVEKKLATLTKSDREKVLAAYDSPDVQNLPPGNTLWRLSNAVSWIAQHKDNSPDHRIELEAAAGAMAPGAKVKAREV